MNTKAEATRILTAEILAGHGLSMAQAAQKVPGFRPGTQTNPATIFRWGKDGIRLADGSRLHLEMIRLAGRWLTSEQALVRFIERQTPSVASSPTPTPQTPTQRDRAARRASDALDKLGL